MSKRRLCVNTLFNHKEGQIHRSWLRQSYIW